MCIWMGIGDQVADFEQSLKKNWIVVGFWWLDYVKILWLNRS